MAKRGSSVSPWAYAGIGILVDFLLCEIAERKGWRVRQIEILRRLRSAGRRWETLTGRRESPIARVGSYFKAARAERVLNR